MVRETTEKSDACVEAISIPSIMKKENISHIDILKIDIEGAEYAVFDDTADTWLDSVECLIIELHDRIQEGCSKRVFDKMSSHGFLYHVYGEDYVFLKNVGENKTING